jgi:hypothetical protein
MPMTVQSDGAGKGQTLSALFASLHFAGVNGVVFTAPCWAWQLGWDAMTVKVMGKQANIADGSPFPFTGLRLLL